MKTIALIPARGGSKRIPKKNIKDFLGQPIIAYPISLLLKTGFFDSVIVSSDDDLIMSVAREQGAFVPFRRPLALSDDHTSTRDVVIHAIMALELSPEDRICCVYPTSVFLTPSLLQEGYEALDRGFEFAMSVVAYDYPIWRSFRLSAKQGVEMLYKETLNHRSQDLEIIYHDAAQFYWGSVKAWRGESPLFGSKTYGVVLASSATQDIDTLEDWKIAEIKYSLSQKS